MDEHQDIVAIMKRQGLGRDRETLYFRLQEEHVSTKPQINIHLPALKAIPKMEKSNIRQIHIWTGD